MKKNDCTLIVSPVGTYIFVGPKVPASLIYVALDGTPATPEQIAACKHCGPRIAGLKGVSFATKLEALKALFIAQREELGIV